MKYITLGGIVALVILSVGIYWNTKTTVEAPVIGSISSDAFGYTSTSTDPTWNSTIYPTKTVLLKNGPGIFGSVVVTGATTAANLIFYDATTTNSHTNHATTTLGVINASSGANTYTFDVSFARGLVVEFPNVLGAASSTMTWK